MATIKFNILPLSDRFSALQGSRNAGKSDWWTSAGRKILKKMDLEWGVRKTVRVGDPVCFMGSIKIYPQVIRRKMRLFCATKK